MYHPIFVLFAYFFLVPSNLVACSLIFFYGFSTDDTAATALCILMSSSSLYCDKIFKFWSVIDLWHKFFLGIVMCVRILFGDAKIYVEFFFSFGEPIENNAKSFRKCLILKINEINNLVNDFDCNNDIVHILRKRGNGTVIFQLL